FLPPPPFTQQTFPQPLQKINQYIPNPHLFQLNLSITQHQHLHTHPYHLYKTLPQLNPSPYISYLHTPHFHILSPSPHLLI
ncbi:chorismate-binding protein, partial [Bacillus sp. WP8]|uniref:chorismate-binding protein n=1 Tax=Bacillus sp. WP8 TaxID=756828 RepID=UPI0016430959